MCVQITISKPRIYLSPNELNGLNRLNVLNAFSARTELCSG